MFFRLPFLTSDFFNVSAYTSRVQSPGLSIPEDRDSFGHQDRTISSLFATSISRYAPRIILVGIVLLYFIYTGVYANQRHLAFETNAFDVGVYTQPIWNFIQGHNFSASIIDDNGPLRWATHVEPILFLLVPVYALWPDPRVLFWLQVAALSLAGLPIFALATRRLHNEWVALFIVVAFFLLPATEAVTLFDFHAVAFAPLFLLSAIYFLERALSKQGASFWLWPELGKRGQDHGHQREHKSAELPRRSPGPQHRLKRKVSFAHSGKFYVLSAAFFWLALSTKEDISLHVFMIGAYLIFLRRRWWEGGLLMVVGLAWFYLAFQVIIPAFRPAGGQSIYASWFESLGGTPLEIVLSPIMAPGKVLALSLRPDNIPPLLMMTLPMAFLPWAGLPLFGLAAPSVAFSLLSQNPTLRQLETWHYAAPMLAFIALGTIDGMARISHYASRSAALGLFFVRIGKRGTVGKSKIVLALLTATLLTTSLIYHHLRGYTPLSQLHEWPEVTAHHQLGREIAAAIPPEASVLAQAQLIPYVAHRRDLGIWDGPLDTEYDYIWFDLSHRKLPNRFDAHSDLLVGLIIEHGFGIIRNVDGYLLLKNGAKREIISEELFFFTKFDQLPAKAQPFSATFGDTLKLVAVEPEVRRLATSETEPQVILYFDTLGAPAEDYHLFLYLLEQDGTVAGATDYPQPALFWWPTSRWQTGDKRQVRVNTIPWWTGDKSAFGYAIGISRTDDPWDVSARLPVTLSDPSLNPPGSEPLDQDTLLPIAAFRRFGGLPYPRPLTTLEPMGAQREE